jgi:hypothetical protein
VWAGYFDSQSELGAVQHDINVDSRGSGEWCFRCKASMIYVEELGAGWEFQSCTAIGMTVKSYAMIKNTR